MLTLTDRAAVMAAIENPALDPHLRALLGARTRQLDDDTEPDVDIANFHAVQPGDSLEAVEQELGITLADDPPFEWLTDHGGWFEAAIVLSDDGFGHILFVADQQGVDPRLLALCRDHLTTA